MACCYTRRHWVRRHCGKPPIPKMMPPCISLCMAFYGTGLLRLVLSWSAPTTSSAFCSYTNNCNKKKNPFLTLLFSNWPSWVWTELLLTWTAEYFIAHTYLPLCVPLRAPWSASFHVAAFVRRLALDKYQELASVYFYPERVPYHLLTRKITVQL